MMNVLDLFCGAVGGWSVGLARAGFCTIAACEIDPWRRAVFAAAHPNCRMYDDVRTLTAERLGNDLGYLPDIVVGSPPCQEISAANSKGKGITDDHLFWEWARLVFELRPLWCAAENSPRARTDGIDGILDALDQAGYAAWPCVVGADNAGSLHARKRLWLVAADAYRAYGWQSTLPNGPASDHRSHSDIDASDSDGDGRRLARGRGIGSDLQDEETHQFDDLNSRIADSIGRIADGGRERRPTEAKANGLDAIATPPDSDRARHPFRPRLGSDDGAELPPALRALGKSWPHWNGGIAGLSAACVAAGFGDLDDGNRSVMAANLRNRAIAAAGDAIIPQLAELIGRSMRIGGAPT